MNVWTKLGVSRPVMVGACLASCAAPPPPQSVGRDSPGVQVAAPGVPQAASANLKRPRVSGPHGGAVVAAWPVAAGNDGVCNLSERARTFQPVELRADHDTIYVDFVGLVERKSERSADADERPQTPTLSLVLNGCALNQAVDLVGTLSTDADELSTVATATAGLPDGELDLRFTLRGDIEVVSIRKTGAVVEPLEFEEHWNFVPSRDGDEPIFLVLDPECGGEEGVQ